MDMQVKVEHGSPSSFASRVEVKENLENLSISELITRLRTAFEMVDFDLVEKALEKKETNLKSENEALLRRIELEKLETIKVENELKNCKQELEKSKEQCKEYKALSEKGKRAQEMHEKLLERVKKNGSQEKNHIAELRLEICKVKNEKCRAESMLDAWKLKFGELSERVSQLEKDAKLLKEERNVGGYTVRECRADKEAVIIDAPRGHLGNNTAETSPYQTNGNTHFTCGAGTRELQRNLNKVVQGASGGGNMGLPTIIEINDSDDEVVADNGHQCSSGAGQLRTPPTEVVLKNERVKRNRSSRIPLPELSSLDTSSSSSDSADLDLSSLPSITNGFLKRKKTEGGSLG